MALAPLLIGLAGASGARGARLGYVTGAVSSLGLLYWTALVVIEYGGLAFPVGVLVMVALCLAFAVFHAAFGWAAARLVGAFGLAGLLGAPVLWAALEYARTHTFFSFPWTLLGYSQLDLLPFAQGAALGGVYLVSFLLCAASALLAYAALEARSARRRPALVALALLVVGAWLHGRWQMSRPVPESGRLVVGLVQGGVRQEDKWLPQNAWSNVGRHLELTEQAAQAGARLVVWPESAVPFLFDEEPGLAALLREAVRRDDLYLFFGNDDREPARGDAEPRLFVGAKLLDPTGEVVARYHKIRLVPFGEYVPLQPLFTLGGRFAAKLVREVSDFTPGREATTGVVDGHRVGGFICYEAVFPWLVRRFAASGAELLLNVTNDAWYGTTSAPHQHLAMTALRAVENRRYLVRAANTGITAIVDPRGRVIAPTRLFDTTVLVREVPLVSETTFYTRHGDVFAQACLAIALALLAASAQRPGRMKQRSDP